MRFNNTIVFVRFTSGQFCLFAGRFRWRVLRQILLDFIGYYIKCAKIYAQPTGIRF